MDAIGALEVHKLHPGSNSIDASDTFPNVSTERDRIVEPRIVTFWEIKDVLCIQTQPITLGPGLVGDLVGRHLDLGVQFNQPAFPVLSEVMADMAAGEPFKDCRHFI